MIPTIKADKVTGLTIEGDVMTLDLADGSLPGRPVPVARVQLTFEACKDLLRHINQEQSLDNFIGSLRFRSEKPN